MKKVTAGLLIVAGALIVLFAVASVVFYFRVYAPNASVITLSGATNLEDRRLREKTFTEPMSDELTEAQVTKFAAVEKEVEARLGARFADFRAAYEQLVPSNDAEVRRVPARPALAAFEPVRLPFLTAKTAQIDALNQASLSKHEFEWVRQRIYRAAGLRLRQVDFSDVLGDLRSGELRVTDGGGQGPIPDRNVALGRPLVSDLQRWTPLAFWGL